MGSVFFLPTARSKSVPLFRSVMRDVHLGDMRTRACVFVFVVIADYIADVLESSQQISGISLNHSTSLTRAIR